MATVMAIGLFFLASLARADANQEAKAVCLRSAYAQIQSAFIRLNLPDPKVDFLGSAVELTTQGMQPKTSLNALSVLDGCDLTLNVDIEAPDGSPRALRLASEASASLFNADAAVVQKLISRCVASRPAAFDSWNDRAGVKQHFRGMSVECQTSISGNRARQLLLTISAKDDDEFYRLSSIGETIGSCLVERSKRITDWIRSRDDLTFSETSVEKNTVSVSTAKTPTSRDFVFKASCDDTIEGWVTATALTARDLATLQDGLAAAAARDLSVQDKAAIKSCLASVPSAFNRDGDRWGKAGDGSAFKVTCRFTREPSDGSRSVEVAIAPR